MKENETLLKIYDFSNPEVPVSLSILQFAQEFDPILQAYLNGKYADPFQKCTFTSKMYGNVQGKKYQPITHIEKNGQKMWIAAGHFGIITVDMNQKNINQP